MKAKNINIHEFDSVKEKQLWHYLDVLWELEDKFDYETITITQAIKIINDIIYLKNKKSQK